MGISSLGVGSSILTQDVLDQLRSADNAKFIQPLELEITNQKDKKSSLAIVDANMTNFIDSIDAIKSSTLYDERLATVSGTSVSVSADANTDIQSFTLEVTVLAKKQIEQSGSFSASSETIANGAGTMNLNIDGQDFTINYDATTTLDGLKDLINNVAGNKVDATIVQVGTNDFRLFISSADTGSTQDITITDNSANLKDTRLTTSLSAVQTGIDATFKFNGQTITRSSNEISDLITGLDITLKETGTSTVDISQNRESIIKKIDSFIEKYNSVIDELARVTKQSTDSSERGIFSSESTIKSMKRAIEDMFAIVGESVGTMSDYGFDIDENGKMSINKDTFNDMMDQNPANVEAFFAGGTFTKDDLSTVEVTGIFNEMSTIVKEYTDFNATLDQYKESLTSSITDMEDRKASMTERLDARYETLKKQYAAYDLMIAKLNNASNMFTQMANASNSDN